MTAGGLLFTVSANVPPRHFPDGDGELSAERPAQNKAEPVDRARTVPANVSLDQIVAVLERAEKLARERSPSFSPTVAQAAAELGMLYTTYQMQQLSFGDRNGGLRVQDAPVVRGAEKGDGTDGVVEEPSSSQDVRSAVPVSYVRASADERGAVAEPVTVGPEAGHVIYDQVVIAAVRLASLLDESVPGASVEVQRTDEFRDSSLLVGPQGLRQRPGSTLRTSLLDVVTAFGGTTLGYANGRIPAAVLCPLGFAPGHMLRCDAAERLTALSNKFEREFGYPIPITDSYRSYVQQIALAGAKPHLAAVPGTSNHGWGLAVDLSAPISGGASQEYTWLRVHGPDYGWDNPSWARPGGTKPEPWHFEFFAAGPIPDRAVDPSDVRTWTSDLPSSSAKGPGPRSIPALDPKPKDGSPDSEVRQRPTKPKDEPSTVPSEPKPKPSPSRPAPKPTAPPTSPAPSPTPTPSEPGQESPGSPAPTPSPAPSKPSQQPSAPPSPTPPETSPSPTPAPTPSGDQTPHAPTPSPSPSVSSGSPSSLAKGPGVDDAQD